MNIQKTFKDIILNKTKHFLFPAVITLVFFAFVFSYVPFREKIQYNTDEGINVMRSMLVVLDHPLYKEVSSDQPPLFTQLLAILFRMTGFELNSARLLVLLFSTLLVWSCVTFLYNSSGKLAAALFLPLILLAPRYLSLSVSVMIGVPSIALAALSILFITIWHRQGKNLWLIFSGFALALSVLIKLFTGFLVPIIVVGVLAKKYFEDENKQPSWNMLKPAIIWISCFFGLAILGGALLVGPANLSQIIQPHLAAPAQKEFQAEVYTINTVLRDARPLLILGSLGAILAISMRKWIFLYLIVWTVLAYALLNVYTPIWDHHQLLVTVPMAALAAVAVSEAINSIIRFQQPSRQPFIRYFFGLCVLIVIAWFSIQGYPTFSSQLMEKPRVTGFLLKGTPGKLRLLRAMEKYAEKTHWIVTDMPLYAFLVKRPVPPIMATFSEKRLATGSITNADVLTAVEQYRPEQVLIGRFCIPELEQYLKENYTLIEDPETFRLYLRNDITR